VLSGVAWSPSGRRLAYVRARGTFRKPEASIDTCDLHGGSRSIALSEPSLWGSDGISSVAWLADGRVVYEVSQQNHVSNLWVIVTDPTTGERRGEAKRLTDWKDFLAGSPRASADGKRLILTKTREQTGVFFGPLSSGTQGFGPQPLTLDGWDNQGVEWTRNSKAILFNSNRTGRWAIFKQNLDAKAPEVLITGAEQYCCPHLSATGAELLYTASPPTGDWDWNDPSIRVMSIPVKGGARDVLMTGGHGYDCGLSASAGCVVAEMKDNQLVFSGLDPVKGKGAEIARGTFPIDLRWRLAPDGSRIAIVAPLESKGEIQILRLADRQIKILRIQEWKWAFLQEVAWAPDGKGLFAIAQGGSSTALLSVDATGKRRVLYEVYSGAGWLYNPIASPDGRYLAFGKTTYSADVVLLENF
jgi:Tol biopolymer transport system component